MVDYVCPVCTAMRERARRVAWIRSQPKPPEVAVLRERFGVSRATAYRLLDAAKLDVSDA